MSFGSLSPSHDYAAFSPFINASPNLSVPTPLQNVPTATQSGLPQHPLIASFQQASPPAIIPMLPPVARPNLDPHMATLLGTLQNASLPQVARPAAAPTFNGFTPREQQLILQAQAQQQVLEAQRKALEMQQQVIAMEAQREALRVQEQARLAMQQQQQQAQAQAQVRIPAHSVFAPIDLVPPMVRPAPVSAFQQPHVRTRTTTNSARLSNATAAQQGAQPHSRATTLPGSHRTAPPSPTVHTPTPKPSAPAVKVQAASPAGPGGPRDTDGDSPLISPALTYSSRGSPSASSTATLSPMTPAFVPGQLPGFKTSAGQAPAHAKTQSAHGMEEADGVSVVGLGVDMGADGAKVASAAQ